MSTAPPMRDLSGDPWSTDPQLRAQWEAELGIDSEDEGKLTRRALWAIAGTALFTLLLVLANTLH